MTTPRISKRALERLAAFARGLKKLEDARKARTGCTLTDDEVIGLVTAYQLMAKRNPRPSRN